MEKKRGGGEIFCGLFVSILEISPHQSPNMCQSSLRFGIGEVYFVS